MTSIKHGLKWNAIGQGVSQVSTILGSILLARVLTPEDFGTVGMITVICGFAYMFLDFGFTSALIQRKHICDSQLHTVFWLYMLIAFILTFGLILSAPLISDFYDQQVLIPICQAISLMFVIGAISQIPKVVLTRSMDFKSLSLGKIIGIPTSYILAIVFALNGVGLWSIVLQILLAPTIETIIILFFTKWKPAFIFDIKSVKELLKFSFSYFSYGLIEYWSKNLDGMLLGKYFGSSPMGIYTRSFAFVLMPVRNISQTINSTVFPKYSQLQEDLPKFRQLFLRINRLQAFVVMPSSIGLGVIAEPLVKFLMGSLWLDMVIPLRVFAIVGIIYALQVLMDTGIFSLAHADKLLKLGFIEKGIVLAGTVVGLRYGLLGVVWARLITAAITIIPKLWLFSKVSEIKIPVILAQFWKTGLSCLVMMIATQSMLVLTQDSSYFLILSASISSGAISYLLCAYLFKEPMLKEVISLLKRKKL